MSNPALIEKVRACKDMLASAYGKENWYRGVAIVPDPKGRMALRLNVASKYRGVIRTLPSTINDIPITIMYIDGYNPRDKGL